MNSLRHTASGLRRAWRTPRLAALLWGVHLVLATLLLAPVATALQAALAGAPATDTLFAAPRLDLFVDTLRQAPAIGARLGAALGVALLLAWVANAFLAAGTLECLLIDEARPLLHRFGRGAGRFGGRFLRLGLAATAAAAVAAALVTAPLTAVRRKLEETGPESTRLVLGLATPLLALATLTVVLMALDLARVRIARDDRRDTLRAFAGALATLLRHPLQVASVWAANAAVRAALWLTAAGLAVALPGGGASLSVLLVALLDQAALLGRAGLRVALWSAEIALLADLDRRSGELRHR